MASACVEGDGSYALAHVGTVSATRVPRRSSLRKSKALRPCCQQDRHTDIGTLIKHLTATWPACDRMAARSSAIPGVSSQDSASLNRISQTKSSRRARGKSCHAPGQRRGGEGLFHGSPRRRTATADCPSARGPQAFAGAFTVTTGQGAVRRTCSATLPISARPSPVRPCVPITIRSHRVSWAAPTIRGAASPFSTR